MPRHYKRRYRRRKPWYSRKYSAMELAGKAVAGVKYLKGLVNVEFKRHDLSGAVVASSTATLTQLSLIAQGDTALLRDGNSIRLKSLLFKYCLTQHATAVNTFTRVIAFRWDDDTAPLESNILASEAIESSLNIDLSHKYHILFDQMNVQSDVSTTARYRSIYKKINIKAKYDGAASTDGQTGQVWLLTLSNEATNTPTLTISSRIRFVDN